MDEENGKGGEIQITEPEDLLVVVDRIKSIPRVKPSVGFRAKAAVYSMFPSLVLMLEGYRSRPEQTSESRKPVFQRHGSLAARYVTVSAVALLLALLIFSGLTFAARNSNPGDFLYSFKRARESLELTFTFDESKKMDKTLTLAQRRLDELDYMIENDRFDPGIVKAVIEDYNSKTSEVTQALQSGKLVASGNIEARFNAVKTAEKNLGKRLAAAGPAAVMTPAGNAEVTVSDSEGKIDFGDGEDSASGVTGDSGEFSFTAEVDSADPAGNIDVVVKTNDRTGVVPAFSPETVVESGSYQASVTPRPGTMEEGQSKKFTLTLNREGKAAGETTVRFRDKSCTSSIDGGGSAATLKTDGKGMCSFELTKTSAENVSRLSLDVMDGAWHPLGEILAIGGVDMSESQRASEQVVTTQTSGGPGDGRDIVIENGLVRITAGSGGNDIISSLSRAGDSTGSVTLSEPSMSGNGGGAPAGQKLVGPRLVNTNSETACYEVSYEVLSENTTLTKTYRVTLEKGEPYASIDCSVKVAGTPGANVGPTLDLYGVYLADGSNVEISGNEIRPPRDEFQTIVDFNPGKPFASVESSENTSFVSCPVLSDERPQSWVLGNNYINMRMNSRLVQNGAVINVSALISPVDSKNIEGLERISSSGTSFEIDNPSETVDSSPGFIVKTKPDYDNAKTGKQRFTITVYKEYENIL